jgi:hypothetical protein
MARARGEARGLDLVLEGGWKLTVTDFSMAVVHRRGALAMGAWTLG